MTHVTHPIFVTHLTHDPSTHSLLCCFTGGRPRYIQILPGQGRPLTSTILGTRKPETLRMVPNFEYTHSPEKARDTTLDYENASQHMTCVVVTALCNQPEAFASDLGDDQ